MTPTELDQVLAKYPVLRQYLNVPELKQLFLDMPATTTPATFTAQLQATDWWRTQSQAQRAWAALDIQSPAEAQRRIAQQFQTIGDQAAQQGIRLSYDALAHLTDDSLRNGWTPEEITRAVIRYAQPGGRGLGPGDLEQTMGRLQTTARSYGVPQSRNVLDQWARNIAIGHQDQAGFEDYVRRQAVALFPTLKAELESGSTVADIFEPYRQTAAQTLGVNPATIDFSTPRWTRALQSRDAGGKLLGPMDIAQWQRTLMTDSQYGYDRSAPGKLAAYQLKDKLEQMFGLVAQ